MANLIISCVGVVVVVGIIIAYFLRGFKEESVPFYDTVDCETCGCIIKKELAVRGESVIKKDKTVCDCSLCKDNPKETLHTPYYCKRCAPVKKGKK